MKGLLFVVLVTFVCMAHAEGDDWSSIKGLKHLNGGTFSEYIQDNNAVIVLFHESGSASEQYKKAFGRAATTRGTSKAYKAVFAEVDCEAARALCSAQSASALPILKLYTDGKFAADYQRDVNSIALLKFAKEPTAAGAGDTANEFFNAESKVTVLNPKTLPGFLKQNDKAFVMFYAPWCGHCQSSKPELISTAQEWTGGGIGAVDCDVHRSLCGRYKVKGFPTFLYFSASDPEGRVFSGDRTQTGFTNFLNDPDAEPAKPAQQPFLDEADQGPDAPAVPPLLGDDSLAAYLKENKQTMVFFYAPWCGHCKHAKPDYARAAETLNAVEAGPRMVAVDCTVHAKTCSDHGVSGYPTIKYFKNGKFSKDYDGTRSQDGYKTFLKTPDSKPEVKSFLDDGSDSSAVHIASTKEDFAALLAKHKRVLTMFYAPWCGHCKHAKPDYVKAAQELSATDGVLAAVDCTASSALCSQYDVKGYPTIKLFSNGKFDKDYEGGRDKSAFLSFMKANSAGGAKAKKPAKPAVQDDDLNPRDEL